MNNSFINNLRAALGTTQTAMNTAKQAQTPSAPMAGSGTPTINTPEEVDAYRSYALADTSDANPKAAYSSISRERLGTADSIAKEIKRLHSPNLPTSTVYFIDKESNTPMMSVLGYKNELPFQMTYSWNYDPRDTGASWIKVDDDPNVMNTKDLLKQMRSRSQDGQIYDLDGYIYEDDDMAGYSTVKDSTGFLAKLFGEEEISPLTRSRNYISMDDGTDYSSDVNNGRDYLGSDADDNYYRWQSRAYLTGPDDDITPQEFQRRNRERRIDKNFFDFVNTIESRKGTLGDILLPSTSNPQYNSHKTSVKPYSRTK